MAGSRQSPECADAVRRLLVGRAQLGGVPISPDLRRTLLAASQDSRIQPEAVLRRLGGVDALAATGPKIDPGIAARGRALNVYTAGPGLDAVAQGATLHVGHSGEGVKALQRLLNARGANLDVDGMLGPKTEAAIKAFQDSAGARPSGALEAPTLSALQAGGAVLPPERWAKFAPDYASASDQNLLDGLSPAQISRLVERLDHRGTGPGGWSNGVPGNWESQVGQLEQQIGRRVRGTDRPDQSYATGGTVLQTGSVGRLLSAISGQESGGNYSAVNPHSGALGKYQVMPANVKQWSQAALGSPITPQQFLASPELQERIVGHRMEQYAKQGMAATGSEEGAVRFAASKWYSGRGELWNDATPQTYNGHRYPSIAQYTSSVYQRYTKA
ncbi:MAG: peptidoglycan-binding protein [Deltaproteobacteria bacterium]|nr:peptidoglycan-binding protein [Deltaproteobacteria bacterium]